MNFEVGDRVKIREEYYYTLGADFENRGGCIIDMEETGYPRRYKVLLDVGGTIWLFDYKLVLDNYEDFRDRIDDRIKRRVV